MSQRITIKVDAATPLLFNADEIVWVQNDGGNALEANILFKGTNATAPQSPYSAGYLALRCSSAANAAKLVNSINKALTSNPGGAYVEAQHDYGVISLVRWVLM